VSLRSCLAAVLLNITVLGHADQIYKNREFVYPEGRSKAVILSYDDGLVQDIRLIEMLNRYHIKGTFHLNSGLLDKTAPWLKKMTGNTGAYVGADEVATIYADHEVASHTVHHRHLVGEPQALKVDEVSRDIARLQQLSGQKVESFAYPFGQFDDDYVAVLAKTGITNARTAIDTGKFLLPDDFLRWHPTAHHSKALDLIDQYMRMPPGAPSVFLLWGHSWEFDRNVADNRWQMMEKICQKLAAHKDVWYAGAGEFTAYINSVKNVALIDNRFINRGKVAVWVKHNGAVLRVAPSDQH